MFYREAIRIDPNDAEAYNNMGTVQAKSGRYEEAIQNFDRAIRLKPDLAVAHYNLGVLSLRAKRREIALQQYHALTSLNSILAVKLYSGIYQGKLLSLGTK